MKKMNSKILSLLTTYLMQDIKEKRDEDLLVLPTDAALFEDPSFKVTKSTKRGLDFKMQQS